MNGYADVEPAMAESANSKPYCSIALATLASCAILVGVVAPLRAFGIRSKIWLFIAVTVGLTSAARVNRFRSLYPESSGRLRRIYDLLLRQLSPPN